MYECAIEDVHPMPDAPPPPPPDYLWGGEKENVSGSNDCCLLAPPFGLEQVLVRFFWGFWDPDKAQITYARDPGPQS